MYEWSTKEVKAQARASYKKNILYAVAVCLIMNLLNGSYTSVTGVVKNVQEGLGDFLTPALLAGLIVTAIGMSLTYFVLRIIVGNVVTVGAMRYFLRNRTERQVGLDPLLSGFKEGHWKNITVVMLMREIRIFLWSLLFVIPGIIKTYEYVMVPYLLAENPEMDYHTALDLSRKMMYGEKFNLFWLQLTFLPWHLLCVLTFGLGEMFLTPYIQASEAEVYVILRDRMRQKEYES